MIVIIAYSSAFYFRIYIYFYLFSNILLLFFHLFKHCFSTKTVFKFSIEFISHFSWVNWTNKATTMRESVIELGKGVKRKWFYHRTFLLWSTVFKTYFIFISNKTKNLLVVYYYIFGIIVCVCWHFSFYSAIGLISQKSTSIKKRERF